MKTFRILGSLSMLGVILLVGCGHKSSKKDETLNLERFISQGTDIACNALVQCSCTDASALADCKTGYQETLGWELGMMQVEYPSRKLDPTAAQKCLDDMKAELSDCNAPMMTGAGAGSAAIVARSGPSFAFSVESCNMEEMFPGTQALGEDCRSQGDCVAGLDCDERTYTCAAARVEGETCSNSDIGYLGCADGLFCYTGGMENVCEKQPAEGELCPHGGCVDGTSCVYVTSLDADACVAPHALDADCGDGAGCVDGTYCDSTSMTPTCKAQLADDADCTSGDQCLSWWCNGLHKCQSPSVCTLFGVD